MSEVEKQNARQMVADLKDEVAIEMEADPVTWATRVTRFGYIADGVVYLLVGLLALDASLGARSPDVSREDALRAIVFQPLGRVMLVIIAVGLVGYSLGHTLMAGRHPAKDDKKGIVSVVNRAAHAINALLHLSLALVAGRLGLGLGPTTGDGKAPADWTRDLLALPLGQALVIGVGLGFGGLALHQLYKAFTANFREVLDPEGLSESQEKWLIWTGRLGYTVRTVLYGLMGVFLIQAARGYDPEEARGLGQTLAAIAGQEYGGYLLGAVAGGLIAFGLYVILMGRYRDFKL